MPNQRVLVVDDEPKIVELVKLYLEREGYRVIVASDGRSALEIARREQPALVVLDLMLPELDGIEVCRQLRRESKVGIVMLTARSEDVDKLIGLELGADDYITKPFSPREVVARVRAVLRRMGDDWMGEQPLTFGSLTIDPARHEVTLGESPVELTRTEFRLLEAMARNAGRVLTRMQLLDKVQGEAFEGYERTIDAHIKNLRQKIEEDPQKPRYILTVYGVGYKFSDQMGR
jgi:DNA-binding response OmpR family regulator